MNSFQSEIAKKNQTHRSRQCGLISHYLISSSTALTRYKEETCNRDETNVLFHADLIKMFLMINEVGIRLIGDIGVMY